MKPKGFLLYADQYKPLCSLTDEQLGRLFRLLFRYINADKPEAIEDEVADDFCSLPLHERQHRIQYPSVRRNLCSPTKCSQ